MTAEQMKYEFEVRVDVLSGSTAPGLTDEEVNVFLNLGQDKIIEEVYGTSGSSLLTELLYTFTSTTALSYTGITNAKKYSWTTLTDVLFLIVDASIQLSRTNPIINSTYFKCEQIDKSIAHNFANIGFNTPWFEQPKLFLEDDAVVVIGDAFTTMASNAALRVDYIKRPTAIDVTDGAEVNCTLRESLHKNIVEKAAELAVEDHRFIPDRNLRNRLYNRDNRDD